MAGSSDPEVPFGTLPPPRPLATVGLLVTLPTDWAAQLRVEVRCPNPNCGYTYHDVGAGAFNGIATFINSHRCNR